MVGAAIIGGTMAVGTAYSARKSAKEANKASKYAADRSAEGFELAKPYLSDMYANAGNLANNALEMGYYKGDSYAQMDPRTQQGLDYLGNQANASMGFADDVYSATSGFANNTGDLYDMANANTLDNALAYGQGERLDDLTSVVMRDPYRELTEQTLPGINMDASASGNMNSSRAGVAEAIENRGFSDRLADTRANLREALVNQQLQTEDQRYQNALSANQHMAEMFGGGINLGIGAGNQLANVGSQYQAENQNLMNDARLRYDMIDRGLSGYEVLAQQGNVMANAPTSTNYNPSYTSPTGATWAGALGGGMAGLDLYRNLGGQINTNIFGKTGGTK